MHMFTLRMVHRYRSSIFLQIQPITSAITIKPGRFGEIWGLSTFGNRLGIVLNRARVDISADIRISAANPSNLLVLAHQLFALSTVADTHREPGKIPTSLFSAKPNVPVTCPLKGPGAWA